MTMQHKIKLETNNIHFMNFISFNDLEQHPKILENLITNYRDIFGEPDIWNERYSKSEIIDKLKNELSGTASMSLCININTNEVIGFCWAQLLSGNEIIKSIQSIHFYKKHETRKYNNNLRDIITNKTAIYIHDLGINKSYRGTIPLEQLICPIIESLSQQTKIRKLVFWSVTDTCIERLAKKIGINVSLTLGEMQLFEGEFPSKEVIDSITN